MKNPGPSGTSKGNMKMFYCYIKLVLGSIQYKSLYNDCAAKTTTTKTTHTYLIQMVDMTGPSHVAMPPDNAKGRIARHLRVVLWVFSGQEKSFNMNAVSICFNDKPMLHTQQLLVVPFLIYTPYHGDISRIPWTVTWDWIRLPLSFQARRPLRPTKLCTQNLRSLHCKWDQFIQVQVLLMEIRRENHLGCIKPVVNNRIN